MVKADMKVDDKKLRTLGDAVARKMLGVAVKAAAPPVEAAVKGHAPERYGFLKKAIGNKVKKYKTTAVVVIGPKSNKKYKIKGKKRKKGEPKVEPKIARPAKYAHLVERGTSTSKPRPFLAPALSSHGARFRKDCADSIKEQIQRQLSK